MVTACCNKCHRFTELVLAELVCEECSDGLDKLWGKCDAADWVLIGVPARSWGSPPPRAGHFLHRNTSYAEVKARWASWPNPCEIRPASSEEIASDEERSQREHAARLAAEEERSRTEDARLRATEEERSRVEAEYSRTNEAWRLAVLERERTKGRKAFFEGVARVGAVVVGVALLTLGLWALISGLHWVWTHPLF
jgi:hypothetical protein